MTTTTRKKGEPDTLAKTIAKRLRAGALVLIVQDPDEALALAEVEEAAKPLGQVKVLSGADDAVTGAIEEQAEGAGTLVLLDALAIYGENPIACRLIRQVALQQRDEGDAFSRLILIERPETTIPASLAGDVGILSVPLPSVEDLRAELDGFLEDQPEATPDGNGETLYAVAAAGTGLARHQYAALLARCVIETARTGPDGERIPGRLDAAWIRREKAAVVSKRLAGALSFESAASADVGGLDNLRAWLRQRRAAFASQKAKAFGLPEPKGLLLVGVPGGGKSLTARTVAREWGLPLLRLDAGKLFGSLVGASEANTRQAIEAAEASAPCVLWLDEIEKAFAGGASGSSTDSGTTQRVFGAFLTWLQDKTAPVFVVATANRVEALPPELLRKGRFDDIFTVSLPHHQERQTIAKIHLERRGRGALAEPAALARLAKATEGFVGAEIEQAIIDGLYAAFDAGRDLTVDDVLAAAKATKPLSATAPEDIKRIEAWADGRARRASAPPAVETTTETTTTRPRRGRRTPKLGKE